MNLFECIGGGSSELQETVLWTNSSPTASMGETAVTLSDSIDNYDYIKFTFRLSSTDTTAGSAIFTPSIINRAVSGSVEVRPSLCGYLGSSLYSRNIFKASGASANQVSFNICSKVNASGSTNTNLIPTAICGLKYAKPKPSGTETTLWENSSPTSSMAETTVTLSDSIANYSKIRFYYRQSTTVDTEFYIDVAPSILQQSVANTNAVSISLGGRTSGIANARLVFYQSNTSITLTACYKMGATGTTATAVIPTKISGIS